MLDDPEKRSQRRLIGIDAADAEEIEMDGSGDVPRCEVFGGPEVDGQRLSPARQFVVQLVGGDEKLGHISKTIASRSTKMRIAIVLPDEIRAAPGNQRARDRHSQVRPSRLRVLRLDPYSAEVLPNRA